MFFEKTHQVQRPLNTFSIWKYLMIVVVLVIAFLYALPNIYGENPAVQLTGLRDTKVSEAQFKEVQTDWEKASITPIAINHINDQKIIARFNNGESQSKAQELANDVLNPDPKNTSYVVALNLAPATPEWLANLGGKPMKLGLDLRGGIYFLMQVDMDKAIQKQQEQLDSDAKKTLLELKPRIRGRIEAVENGILLQVKPADFERALGAINKAFLNRADVTEVSRNGLQYIQASFNDAKLKEIRDAAVDQNRMILSERVNSLGVAEPQIQRQGADRIVVQLPGVQDSALAKQVLGATATLEFRLVNEKAMTGFAAGDRVPTGSTLFYNEEGRPVVVYDEVRVTGEHLIDAYPGKDGDTREDIVHVKLDSVGGSQMLNTTVKHRGERLAMVLVESEPQFKDKEDGTKVLVGSIQKERLISAPSINGKFGSDFQISGNFSPAETKDLALNLRSGALVAPTFFIEERTVGPTLGAENIEKGFKSVVIGFCLVLVFMLIFYKLFGVVANIALTLNLVLITAIMSILGATLTLPGIAGIVLTVGMAVDANVLIFERIKEELRLGSRPAQAIDKGYAQALSTIADANITTMIAAIILYAIGTGPVKGFAITLFVGILTSMFTAIVVSRGIVNLVYGNKKVEKLSI